MRFAAYVRVAQRVEITANESHAGGDSITATNGSIVTVLFFRPSDDGGTDIYQITEGQ